MPQHSAEAAERERDERNGGQDLRSRAKQVGSTVTKHGRSGSIAAVVGGVLLASSLRTMRRNRGRATLQALAGAALVGFGLRQRRSRSDRSAGTNPRGVSGEPDVETETDPDEGRVQFTDEQDDEPRQRPHIEEGPEDPRYHEEEDDEVDIDLSEAAMADEASEATGPAPEQAQPAETEGTEPEPTAEEDASHEQADQPGTASGADTESDELDESEEFTESESGADEVGMDADADEGSKDEA